MTISLSILLYIYLALVAVFVVFSIFNIYHLIKFSDSGSLSIIITTLYIIVALVIFFISWIYISQIDWQTEINIFFDQTENLFNSQTF